MTYKIGAQKMAQHQENFLLFPWTKVSFPTPKLGSWNDL